MRVIKGFTILELLIVVIIVGILASLAIPYYIKTAESSKAAEAYTNLGAIRQAELVYYSKTGIFIYQYESYPPTGPTSLSGLNIEDPHTMSNRSFNYVADDDPIGAPPVIMAVRKDGPYQGDYIAMDINGSINEDNWLQ